LEEKKEFKMRKEGEFKWQEKRGREKELEGASLRG